MYKKWKSVTALSMAALLGCIIPMGTMMAAEETEENTEVVQEIDVDSVSDSDAGYDEDADLDENDITDDEDTSEEVIVNTEADADNDGDDGTEVMSDAEETETENTEVQACLDAPVIDITLNGTSYKVDGLGGKIDYKYVNNLNQVFEFSASQENQETSFYYYIDRVEDITANARDEEQMASLWPSEAQSSSMTFSLSLNENYVLYVKAVGEDGQTTYARSGGVVVDTVAPKIVGLEEGKAYPEGTAFKVEEANLESVKVNETLVTPESDGSYLVSANGTSCVIRVKDKAGNEKTCSITVTARVPGENGVISVNGTYSLKAGTAYQLAEGKWQVRGDNTVYQGGSTFYVKTDGDYRFTKR